MVAFTVVVAVWFVTAAVAFFFFFLLLFYFDVAKAQLRVFAEARIVAKFQERLRHSNFKIIDKTAQLLDAVSVGLQVNEP